MVEESARKGLTVNKKKTETMVISKTSPSPSIGIFVNGEELKQVKQFNYLGSLITEDGRSEKEIKKRIAAAKRAFGNMKTILTNGNISLKLRKRFIQTYIWSTMLYGCEAWTINQYSANIIEAAEMWIYRGILRISWRDRVTNVEVLNRMSTERAILNTIKQRQLRFFGHTVREGDLEADCVMGKMDGKRPRGRPRIKFTNSLASSTRKSTTEMIQKARIRTTWRSVVANVSRDTAP